MEISPTSDSSGSESGTPTNKKYVTTGYKEFAPVGVSYIKPKDKLCMEVYLMVIKDYEDNNEEGIIHTEKFWLTSKVL